MSLETQIALGLAGTLVGTIIALLFCLWLLERSVAREVKRTAVPKCIIRVVNGAAHICSWCPDSKDGAHYAEKRSLIPSHGICLPCRAKHFPTTKRVTRTL